MDLTNGCRVGCGYAAREIHLDKAGLYASNPVVGDVVEKEMDHQRRRIAAKTAEQAIKQRLRQFEKEHIYDEFSVSW